MRVQREPGFVIRGVSGSKMVQQQERIKIVQRRGANTSPQPHSGSFDHGLRLDYSFYASLLWLHASSSPHQLNDFLCLLSLKLSLRANLRVLEWFPVNNRLRTSRILNER